MAALHLRHARAHRVAGQPAADEDDEAVQARDAVPAEGERVDRELELLVLGDGRGHPARLRERRVQREDRGRRGFWEKSKSAREVAELRRVLAHRRPRIRPAVGAGSSRGEAQEVVLDELCVGVELQRLVVDVPAPRVRADHEPGTRRP